MKIMSKVRKMPQNEPCLLCSETKEPKLGNIFERPELINMIRNVSGLDVSFCFLIPFLVVKERMIREFLVAAMLAGKSVVFNFAHFILFSITKLLLLCKDITKTNIYFASECHCYAIMRSSFGPNLLFVSRINI